MKLELSCPRCTTTVNDWRTGNFELIEIELRDDGAYLSTCSNGHRFITNLQQQHFQMLFELGLNALVDGYYREAVSSFTAALERFYEFSLRIFSSAHGAKSEDWSATWQQIQNMSERQLGAYAVMHLVSIKKPARLLTSRNIEFRNAVVHKGRIPSKSEALKFGETIRELLNLAIHDINQCFAEELVSIMVSPTRKRLPEECEPDVTVWTMSYSTTVSLMNMEFSERAKKSLEQILDEKVERRTLMQPYLRPAT